MKYRAELREIAITRNAVMFLSLVLPLFDLVDGFNIVGNNEFPITEALPEHFFGFPSEESLRRRRPAQHAEFMVPLDDGERRVFHVEGEATMLVDWCGLCKFAFGYVANDRDATDHFT